MPLSDGYGVVIGTREKYYRDPVNNYGQYFHGNVEVRTPAGLYRCAIDVDSKSVPNGVQWRVVELGSADLKGIASLPDGWHGLASTRTSGALDYIRNPRLRYRSWLALAILSVPQLAAGPAPSTSRALRFRFPAKAYWLYLIRILQLERPWKSGVSTDALSDLEPLMALAQRVFIFGEPFTSGLGVHNIHQNQGDPVTSQWSAENGIWQDGATLVQRIDGTFAVFMNKFVTQSSQTDSNGKPLP